MGQNPLRLKIPKIQAKVYLNEVLYAIFSNKKISDFESEFSKKTGIMYCNATYSGRSALIAILRAMDFKKGDEIIMPGFTFIGLARIIKDIGFVPVFCDVDEKTLNIKEDRIKELITKKTKAVLIVHNLGNPCNMDYILKICNKHKIKLIEDCAHSISSKYKGKNLGTFGDAAIFSFHYSKIINTFYGGIAATNNKILSVKIKKKIGKFKEQKKKDLVFRIFTSFVQSVVTSPFIYTFIFSPVNAIYKKIKNEDIVESLFKLKPMDISSHEYKFTDFQARIGLTELKNLDNYNLIRKKYYSCFKEKLKIKTSTQEPNSNSEFIPLQLVFFSENKKEITAYLEKKKIEAKEFYISNIHDTPEFKNYNSNCKNIRKIESKIIYFPTFHYLKLKDIEYISKTLNSFQ